MLDRDVLIGSGHTVEEGAAEPLFAALSVVREDRTVSLRSRRPPTGTR